MIKPNDKHLLLRKIEAIYDHWSTTVFLTTLTIYALFGDNFRLLMTSKEADSIFFSITCAIMGVFLIEIITTSIAKEGYLFSFYFWLDLVSTISMIIDIGWIWDEIFGTDSTTGRPSVSSSQFARAAKTSRAGARAARIIKIVRVVKMIRIFKLYKLSEDAKAKFLKNNERFVAPVVNNVRGGRNSIDLTEEESELNDETIDYNNFTLGPEKSKKKLEEPRIVNRNSENNQNLNVEYKSQKESKIGEKLSEMTIKKVITLALGMVIILPLFYSTLYYEDNNSFTIGLAFMFANIDNESAENRTCEFYISEHKNIMTPLIYLDIQNVYKWESSIDPANLRSEELTVIIRSGKYNGKPLDALAMFDMRDSTRKQAGLDLGMTLGICLTLTFGAIYFTKDNYKFIIWPIENMMKKVNEISENPVKAAQQEEIGEFLNKTSNKNAKKDHHKILLETSILEKTLVKIGALLVLGFGEAGSEVITKSMKRGGGDIVPMIAGQKKYCIFGFCDIRNFSETTEVLQQDIMIFVNEIAKIVHNNVNKYLGSPNKNIGQAFLLVWKFPKESISENKENVKLENNRLTNSFADLSLISFLKIIAEICKSPKIESFSQHPALNAMIPGYIVSMGFGLHQGWAIEGTIGSSFKIDASYLSPNVNIASRIEAATKQFGVPLLVSQNFYSICSQTTQQYLRKIDRVTLKGTKAPMDLYTFDLDTSTLKVSHYSQRKEDTKNAKVLEIIKRERLNDDVKSQRFSVSSMFIDDHDLKNLRKNVSLEFIEEFSEALTFYLEGDWVNACNLLKHAKRYKVQPDGPTETLLEFMEEYGGIAPIGWAGYRELVDK
ncbi:unnamed protein product [Blepharisma stoltei]|uniref:Guanylate cyclase domain-containing protein n=1 Tax=Blepharisma stoltei TaxID=1481888 RepID=A0AAU9JM34_9CILI|nr:unnamed protein product [Blepharisma stoltei]